MQISVPTTYKEYYIKYTNIKEIKSLSSDHL